MGYGVSTGGSGQMSMRGIGGPAQAGLPTTGLLVLIDGHPQYMGLMGHPIADAYQSMLVERVEVVRGPASVLYGSNAMGGVVNIVTRHMAQDGIKTDIDVFGRLIRNFQERSCQPHTPRQIFKHNNGFLQSLGRSSPRHGVRAIRRILEIGLRLLAAVEIMGRREHHAFQRIKSW